MRCFMNIKKVFLFPCSLLLALTISSCGSSTNSNPFGPNSSSDSQIATSSSNSIESSHNEPSHSSSNPISSSVDDFAVTSVSLNTEQLTLYVGQTVKLTATVYPLNATNQEVTWSSSKEDVATVEDGVISAKAEGTTNITVTTSEGGFTATCELTVIKEDEEDPYVPDETDGTIYFITEDTLDKGSYDASSDEYTFTITSNYKQLYVNLPDKSLTVELQGVTLENNENSPIYVENCENIDLSAKKNTTNTIKDTRPAYVNDEEGQGKGAIYVENGDLKLKGTGILNITANYLNGIHCKDDVKVQKQTLNINAINHGIRGNDSVTITSGAINISCGGDALHSENSDVSNKGNQKGNVTINGGSLTINSWADAIQAAYDAVIEQTDPEVPISINAKTNKYSSYNGETIDTSTDVFYLKMNSSTYSNGGYTYAAYINGAWYPATYKGTQSSQQGGSGGGPGGGGGGRPGSSSTYYLYQLQKPTGATSFTLYRFKGSNVTEFSTTNYNAVSDAKAFNSAYDTVQISVSGSTISFSSWSNYSSGNNNGADVSAKGIKAENKITIKSGTIDIKAYDDAIHANNDGILENGSSPLGNVNISGGDITVSASDDGIHADGQLNISGGTINVTTSYEGLEGNVINVTGGNSYVYGTDDGVNATNGKSTAAINVSGGLLDVEVPTNGDTDGIDSNGAFTQTGGTVIVKGPGSASGGGMAMAAALDTDGAVKITSGSLIVFGAIEQTPNSSVTKTLASSTTVKAGTHTISFASSGTSYSTTLKSSSNGCVVYSSLGTATLN